MGQGGQVRGHQGRVIRSPREIFRNVRSANAETDSNERDHTGCGRRFRDRLLDPSAVLKFSFGISNISSEDADSVAGYRIPGFAIIKDHSSAGVVSSVQIGCGVPVFGSIGVGGVESGA